MELTKSKIFLIAICFFVLGIFISSIAPTKIIGASIVWFSGLILFVVITVLFFNVRYKNFRIGIAVLWAVFLLLGLWRYSISIPYDQQNKIWHYNDQEIKFIGVVNNEPDIRGTNQKLEIESEKIVLESWTRKVSGKVLLTANLYPKINYGDRLEIRCQLQKAEEFDNFAYDRYLARFNIYSVCYWPEISILETGQGNKIYSAIFSLKDELREKINKNLGFLESGLARAMFLGDKRAINDEQREIFSQTGLSHIVAISGMHISILSGLVMFLLLGLGLSRKYSFYFSILFLIIYIFLIGAPASAMRAGIMGFLLLLAIHLGRLNKTVNTLTTAALILLLINPRLLYDDVGFQLSFLAVLGISLFYPLANNYLEETKIKIPEIIKGILLVTLGAQILTWPIIAINFGKISLISIISNLLVVWVLPFLISGIVVALIISFIVPLLAPVFFGFVNLIINYILLITLFLSKIPGSYMEINSIPIIVLIIYYGLIIYLFFYLRKYLSK